MVSQRFKGRADSIKATGAQNHTGMIPMQAIMSQHATILEILAFGKHISGGNDIDVLRGARNSRFFFAFGAHSAIGRVHSFCPLPGMIGSSAD